MKSNSIKIIVSLLLISILTIITSFYLLKRKPPVEQINLTLVEKEWLADKNGVITIAGDPYYPPVDFINEKGEHDGISEEFIRKIEQKLNIRFKRVRHHTWSDVMDKARSQELDVISCMAYNEERSSYLNFSIPYMTASTVVVTHKSDTLISGVKDLAGKRTAISLGYGTYDYYKKNFPEMIIVPTKNDGEALQMVSLKEVDAAISDLPTISYFVEKNKISNLRIKSESGFIWDFSFAVRKDWPVLSQILSKAVSSISEDEKKEIIGHWIQIEYNTYLYSAKFWQTLLLIIGAVAAIISLFLLWNKSLRILVKERTRELNDYKENLEILVADRTKELKQSNTELTLALSEVRTLKGLLPICASCKKIRDDNGYWNQIESYISRHSGAEFTHSICPACAERLYPDDDDDEKKI